MLDKKQIQMAPLFIIQTAATADLSESTKSGFRRHNERSIRPVVGIKFLLREGTRTNESHVSQNDMPELRQFVHGVTTAKCCKTAGDAQVLLVRSKERSLGRRQAVNKNRFASRVTFPHGS